MGRHQGSRFATEPFWRQMQAKDCTKSHPQQSLKFSLFCTRVVCSDCKVSLQSSSRVILFLTLDRSDVRKGSWVGKKTKITMSGKERIFGLDLNTLRMCGRDSPDGEVLM